MSKIIRLEINHFRGIKKFEQDFNEEFICFIGRGDSGKTTILEAIAYVLSPSWKLNFYDTDFYNCDINTPIQIKATLKDFPEELLSQTKYGLYIDGYDQKSQKITEELSDNSVPVLTIMLTIDKNLEPQWAVINSRNKEEKNISSADRGKLNCFLISDYVDRHFSWSQGNPLYTLMKVYENKGDNEDDCLLDAIRNFKKEIDRFDNKALEETTKTLKTKVAEFGLNIDKSKSTIDFKDLFIKDDKMCLHDANIPFRLKGKGSKRLLSMAIQSAIVNVGGILLVDEIEQGLEPDRIKQVAKTLKFTPNGQIFITTHSRDVITELDSKDLFIIQKDESSEIKIKKLDYEKSKLQGVIRACPEAFFAKKIIVCEGPTEIGICRALDTYRINNGRKNMSFKDCAYIDGSGDNFPDRANDIKGVGLAVAIFCDSDKDDKLKISKVNLKEKRIEIFDCESGNSMEKQVFSDLNWESIKEIIDKVKKVQGKSHEQITETVKSKYTGNFPDDWLNDSREIRDALAKASVVKINEWFKRIDHGEMLGNTIFKYIGELDEKNHLKTTLLKLSEWIDK